MHPLLRLLVAGLLALLAWVGWLRPALAQTQAQAQPVPTVQVYTTSPVAPGRYALLAQAALPLGFSLQVQYVEKLPATPAPGPALWDGAALVLFDAPRQHMEDFMRSRLAAALPALAGRPHAWLSSSAAQPGGGLDAAFAQRLQAYHQHGGAHNRQQWLASLASWLRLPGAAPSWAMLPAPQLFPAAGFYHPRLPGLVTADAEAYLATLQRVSPLPAGAPVVAIAFHPQSISAEQTALLDDLIARLEAGGARALPFYGPVMGAEPLVRQLSDAQGRPRVDALINTQITLDAEGRRKAFEALGVPVVQAMSYRRGDASTWAADPQGVPLMDVPFYLAQAEYAGITDIQIAAATRAGDEQLLPIAGQSAAIAQKALRLVALQRKPAAAKRVAIFFWNYPSGEKNLSASFMNLPRSLSGTLAALQQAGYGTQNLDADALTTRLQRLLTPAYRPPEDRQVLRELLRDGLADRLPLSRYRAWLATLPEKQRAEMDAAGGAPERSAMLLSDGDGEPFFVIPRLQLGTVSLLPQPGRGERGADREKALYHSMSAAPTHYYMAVYLWAREQFAADALVHFGTHGSQEWLPGKERGLAVTDYPMLAVGDLPVLYPYIVDNIGEATQAKRRGRAVILSHQTPPLVPAGLHDRLTTIHDLLHQWLAQDGGGVKDQLRQDFLARVRAERIPADMGWSEARIQADFNGFVSAVHDHLHELALSAQPMGLHTFGAGPDEPLRVASVLMMLGKDFWEGTADAKLGEEADEMLIADHRRLVESKPYRLLAPWLRGEPGATLPAGLKPERAAQARTWYEQLGARGELAGLLAGLAGRHIPTSYGGDPIKNPDALPTGRNLYGFDPSRVPTRAAWEAGKAAMDQLIAAHRAKTGSPPTKLALTLWSVETMRHFGVLEAQALWALGVQPQWDAGGRVSGVQLIPREQLGRPRVDVVLSATGLYRDHFPNVMRQLARAAELAAAAVDEADNPVAANARRIARSLAANGVPEEQARLAGATRIFSSASGRYGTGLDDAALATDSWKTQAEGDRKLATLYLQRMQYAYGPDESRWGQAGVATAGALNLYAEHLRGTQGAVLARSSNLYGMLTTDDPFQYLGGLGLAVRHLDGQAPELYISNLRGTGPGGGKVEGAAEFLAKELATRNFHPGYIQGLMREGYSGTLQVLDGINNFAGWQSVAREIVRHDQWQEFMDVYVRDKHELGLARWFEQHNPHALAQSIERMLEAARLGQWQADARSVAELKARYNELARRHDVRSDNAEFKRFVQTATATATPGFGMQAPAGAAQPQRQAAAPAAQAEPPPAAAAPPPPPPVTGLRLDRVLPRADDVATVPAVLAALLALGLVMAGGAWRARRSDHPGTALFKLSPLSPKP
ncbi:MAG: cobaltochelatase subunit CobN [Burkholderiaceae bacterium]|nr:cobaltochelatase subunit CobN [Burkholderiaceae bacterium]